MVMMMLRFAKMHGLGNDFVVVDAATSTDTQESEEESSDIERLSAGGQLARRLCDRKFGIGADGLIFVLRTSQQQQQHDFRFISSYTTSTYHHHG